IQGATLTSGGATILRSIKTIKITRGVLLTTLIPNDTATPQYTAYLFAFGNGAEETCAIPTSATPITLAGNCVPGHQRGVLLNSALLSEINLAAYVDGWSCPQVVSGIGVLSSSGCHGSGGGGESGPAGPTGQVGPTGPAGAAGSNGSNGA